jgi:type IV secretory pathway VirB6-like protein
MTFHLPVSLNGVLVITVAAMVSSVLIGIALAGVFGSVYPMIAIAVFWAVTGAAIHLEFRCRHCNAKAPLAFEYRDGPAGQRVYPVLTCSECGTAEVI